MIYIKKIFFYTIYITIMHHIFITNISSLDAKISLNNPKITINQNTFSLTPNNSHPQHIIEQNLNAHNITSCAINDTLNIVAAGESGYHAQLHLLTYEPETATLHLTESITPLSTDDFYTIYYMQWFCNQTYLMTCCHTNTSTISLFSYANNTLSFIQDVTLPGLVENIKITPSGNFMAIGYENKLNFYTITDSNISLITSLEYSSCVSSISWASDEHHIAFGIDDTLYVAYVDTNNATPIASTHCIFNHTSIFWNNEMTFIGVGNCQPTCENNIIISHGCSIFSFNGENLQIAT